MKLAHIVPISLLDTIPEEQRTHLVLSELLLSNESYFRFYVKKRARGDLIILDNPVHEDRPVSIERWIKAVIRLLPQVAVIPDEINSAEETIVKAITAVRLFRERELHNIELMAVPHGTTQQDWLSCAHVLAGIGEPISWLGLSLERRLNDDMHALSRRRERVQMLKDNSIFDRFKLHLLGTSEVGYELSDDKIWQRAESMDSSKFAVWYMRGYDVRPPVPITQPYPGRTPFGGSYAYFFTGHPDGLSRRKMRANLKRWVDYAEREIG